MLNVLIANDSSQPVPVAQQGTANVNVTNSTLTVAPASPITSGGQSFTMEASGTPVIFGSDIVVSAFVVHFRDGAGGLLFLNNNTIVGRFLGPPNGPQTVTLALSRPMAFDALQCNGPDGSICAVSWIGNAP